MYPNHHWYPEAELFEIHTGQPAGVLACVRAMNGGVALRRATASGRDLRPGFTLIELLVVVAILGILASLLLPALTHARSRARATVCLGNQRQLGIALELYAGDAQDRLPYNFGASGTLGAIQSGRFDNWANQPVELGGGSVQHEYGLAAGGRIGTVFVGRR